MSDELCLMTCPRFDKGLDGANALTKKKVHAEIHQFVEYFEHDPVTVAGKYKTFQNVAPYTVLEFRIDYKMRALGHWDDHTLTLVDVGNHDHVYDPFCTEVLESQLEIAEQASNEYWPDKSRTIGLFASNPDKSHEQYGPEDDPEWIYFLTSEQTGYVKSIVRNIKKSSKSKPRRIFVVGGPGTGKTSVLARLLIDLTAEGFNPGISVTDEVAELIECGGEFDLSNSRLDYWDRFGDGEGNSFDVALIDDPTGIHEIESYFDSAEDRFNAVIIAFDPCQLDSDMDDEMYDTLCQALDAKPYQLTACYRQKENVGLAARRIMDTLADSTPFLAKKKIEDFRDEHEFVYRLSNTLSYPNRHGYEEIYESARFADFEREVRRIRRRPLWKHTCPLLVVTDKDAALDEWDWEGALSGVSFRHLTISSERFSSLKDVKGLEYQHAFFLMGSVMFKQINEGFEGSGQPKYHGRRLLRIPFSRAKDSVVTFVVPD